MALFRIGFYLFFVFLFIVPDKSVYIINLGIGQFNVFQFCALFIPFFYAFSSLNSIKTSPKIKKTVFAFLLYFFISSLFKSLYFSNGISDLLKDYRIASMFIAAILIIYLGAKINLKNLLYIFLISIIISYLISLSMMILGITITSSFYEEEGFTSFVSGRLFNANKDLAFVGIYLIFNLKNIKYLMTRKLIFLIYFTSVFSIIMALLSFDRTLLAMMIIVFLYLLYKNFSLKTFGKFIVYILIGVFTITIAYNSNESIKHQVDRRILSVLESNNQLQGLNESVWEGNRDYMIMGAIDTFLRHPLFGTNQKDPLFYYPNGDSAMQTDVTFINILARHGIVGFILFINIFIAIFTVIKKKRNGNVYNEFLISLINYSLIIFLLYGLNHDTIFRGSIIIFIAFLIVATNYNSNNLRVKQSYI